MKTVQLTAIIEREGDGYVALCPDVDVASQGASIDEARTNLQEALELFFETADESEIRTRLHTEVLVTRLEVAVGQVQDLLWQAGLRPPRPARVRPGPPARKPRRHAEALGRDHGDRAGAGSRRAQDRDAAFDHPAVGPCSNAVRALSAPRPRAPKTRAARAQVMRQLLRGLDTASIGVF